MTHDELLNQLQDDTDNILMDLAQQDAYAVRMLEILDAIEAMKITQDEGYVLMQDTQQAYEETQAYKKATSDTLIRKVFGEL